MADYALPSLISRLKIDTTGLAKAEAEASGFAGRLGTLLAGTAIIGAAIGVGIVVGMAAATKAAGDFQKQLTELVTGAGETRDNIAMVSDGLLKMAGQTGTSATELAKGMYMVESAGFHGAAGLLVMQAAAEGAKVGAASLATTANAVTTVLKDYHMPATQAAEATNFLVSVVSQGKTHMEDLAQSLAAILPTASALGVPLAQVGGAMATLTARGVPAADAATYLRFTLSALAAETPKGAKALESIGLTSLQVGNTLTHQGLLPALEMIQTHLTKKFPAGGAAMFATLKDITGGTRGLGAALGLTGQNLADFEAATKNVSNQIAAGKGQVIGWTDVQGELNFKMDAARAAIEAAGIKIGMVLLPYATQLLGVITPMIPVVAAWAEKMTTQLVPQIILFAGWLKSLGPDLQKAYDLIKAWAPEIIALAAAWAIWNIALEVTKVVQLAILAVQFAAGLVAIISKVGLLTAAQWLLNIAMDANPIGIVIIAVAALVAGLVWAYQNVGWFREAVNDAWTQLKQLGSWLVAVLTPILQNIGGFFDRLGSSAHVLQQALSALTGSGGTSSGSGVAAGSGKRGSVIPAASGFEGVVTRPTFFLAGEGGSPERVSIGNGGGGSGLSDTLLAAIERHLADLAGRQPLSASAGARRQG
jgi:TP901 family phage tail tape measure protein